MKKAIEILEQHIRSYRGAVELYEANPGNQAISDYSAKDAARNIIDLQAAVAALRAVEKSNSASTNSDKDAIALLERCTLVVREGSLYKDICEYIERQRHQ